MKTYHSPLLLCLLCQLAFVYFLSAQSTTKPYYHGNVATATSRVATTGTSGTGSNIDVVYHRAEWRINPDSTVKAISGSVTTYFVTTVANVSVITFDLRKSAFDNANLKIKYRGTELPSTSHSISTTNVLSINLGVSLPADKLDSVTIYYGGTPPAVTGAAEGFQLKTDATSGQKYIYTLSESYEDRDWWPCKADMQDKIDSMDIIVSTPWVGADTFWVASNGVLIDSAKSGNSRYFTFKNRYPMASYLVCLSVARYNRYYTSVNVGGTNVPVVYNLFRGKTATTYNNILAAMNKINEAVVALSAKFGDYPFKKEKHGFYEGLGGAGGMEHQTFSAIASNALTSKGTLTHELMHQWFGDKVTFATWNHLWLAEGFARYSESLVAELVAGTGLSAFTERSACKTATIGNGTSTTSIGLATTSLVIPDASMATSDGIWNGSYGSAVYEKGAMVVSMLRKLAGDAKFFQACSNYLNDPALAYRSATTDDLKSHFEAVLNYDLDPFFTDYASTTGKGNPAYDVNWGSTGTGINIELTTQRRSNTTGVTYFRTPVVLKIYNSGKTKDTSVVIYDQNGQLSYAGNGISAPISGKVLGYNLSFVPASVEVDPDAETLVRGVDGAAAATNKVGQSTVTKATRLNTTPVILPPVIVLPITIIDFKGAKKAEGNYLSLALTITSENISMLVERSENGIDFSTLGQMVKQNGIESNINYSYLDKNTQAVKDYYYRVKTIDEKGAIKYSKVIVLSGSSPLQGMALMPNPANDHVTVIVPQTRNSEYISLAIVNSSGAVIERKLVKPVARIRVKVEHLPVGNYAVVINDEKQQRWAKTFSVIR